VGRAAEQSCRNGLGTAHRCGDPGRECAARADEMTLWHQKDHQMSNPCSNQRPELSQTEPAVSESSAPASAVSGVFPSGAQDVYSPQCSPPCRNHRVKFQVHIYSDALFRPAHLRLKWLSRDGGRSERRRDRSAFQPVRPGKPVPVRGARLSCRAGRWSARRRHRPPRTPVRSGEWRGL
jgi:hypothetical protein